MLKTVNGGRAELSARKAAPATFPMMIAMTEYCMDKPKAIPRNPVNQVTMFRLMANQIENICRLLP
jgi:hypothetical protein